MSRSTTKEGHRVAILTMMQLEYIQVSKGTEIVFDHLYLFCLIYAHAILLCDLFVGVNRVTQKHPVNNIKQSKFIKIVIFSQFMNIEIYSVNIKEGYHVFNEPFEHYCPHNCVVQPWLKKMYALVLDTLKDITRNKLKGFYKSLFIHWEYIVCYLNDIYETLWITIYPY